MTLSPSKFATIKYKLLAGVAILVALAIAIYASHTIGYNKGKNISQVEITKYEKEAGELRTNIVQARAKVNERIVTEYVTQVVYRDRTNYINRDIVQRVVVDRPIQQTVSKGWIYAHNQFALGLPIDPTLAADKTVSGVLDTKILDKVADNYRIGQNGINLAEAFQKYHRDTEAAYAKANK